MRRKALIFYGGWDGHEPKPVSEKLGKMLQKNGYNVKITDSMEILGDIDYLMSLDLIVPCWTMGEIKKEHRENIMKAVSEGTGLAGCHGGMCDAFRNDTEWQFMTGGQWVSHPGGDKVDYTVNICKGANPITDEIEDFSVLSEQYYLHIDPAIEVLATTRFPVAKGMHSANKPIDMPVVWTKFWGLGRVFYNSLGHHADIFDNLPSAAVIMERGMLWAGEGKEYAEKNGLTTEIYR